MGDFETTVYDGQERTDVWASALVEVGKEDVLVFHSIDDTFNYLLKTKGNIMVFYHNLKFDGSFWINYLLNLGYKTALEKIGESETAVKWIDDKKMESKSFKYIISNRGQWYSIIIKEGRRIIQMRDSLKLLPFSVKRIGNSFSTKHKKLDMEYKGIRFPGCTITDEERKYIANDVLVVKEAIEFMFAEGHDKMTIGSCCLAEYKKLYSKEDWELRFPNIYNVNIDPEEHTYTNAGDWIRKTYKGGWTYLVKGKENRFFHNGTTADVNSLYPSVMHGSSGNVYPIGKPHFWTGDFIPDEATGTDKYYFVHINTRFYLKEGYLPFIQVKGSWLYKGTECLETSDIYDKHTGTYSRYYKDFDGEIKDTNMDLYLTKTDFLLIQEHYNLVDCRIVDGCYFGAVCGLFDEYINKYAEIKMHSKGAVRELAKLYLNNLYGKFATSEDSSFKVAYLKEDKSLGFYPVLEFEKEPGYIPIGSAITSYARNFTIRAAQKNFHGVDKPGFIYADTDSLHLDLLPEEIQGINVDEVKFSHWKLESCWDTGLFVRQKTYIEHITHDNLIPIENPYYNVKCAGMPEKCKNLFLDSLKDERIIMGRKYTTEEIDFLLTKRELSDFKVGLKVPGKLMPKQIPGGVLLTETTYEMR